jgi:hypothetical protein
MDIPSHRVKMYVFAKNRFFIIIKSHNSSKSSIKKVLFSSMKPILPVGAGGAVMDTYFFEAELKLKFK